MERGREREREGGRGGGGGGGYGESLWKVCGGGCYLSSDPAIEVVFSENETQELEGRGRGGRRGRGGGVGVVGGGGGVGTLYILRVCWDWRSFLHSLMPISSSRNRSR